MSTPTAIRSGPPLHGNCATRRPATLMSATAAALASSLLFAAMNARAAEMAAGASTTPAYGWGGCYVGLNAGAGAGGSSFNTTVGPGTHLGAADAQLVATTGGDGSANATSAIGGGQAGCNWQSGALVFGLEADIDLFTDNPRFFNGSGALSSGNPFSITQSLKTDYLATVRPRIGIAADRDLAYVTGGVAFSNASYTQTYLDTNTPAGSGGASASKSLVGWTAGAGWEHAWSEHWTFKVEYLFAKFPTTVAAGSIVDSAGGSNPLQGSADLTVQTLRAGLNFKF